MPLIDTYFEDYLYNVCPDYTEIKEAYEEIEFLFKQLDVIDNIPNDYREVKSYILRYISATVVVAVMDRLYDITDYSYYYTKQDFMFDHVMDNNIELCEIDDYTNALRVNIEKVLQVIEDSIPEEEAKEEFKHIDINKFEIIHYLNTCTEFKFV